MDINVYSIKDINDQFIEELICKNESFVLEGIRRTNMGDAVKSLESLIESKGLRCRIYTKGRAATIAASWTPAVFFGLASAITIGAHNVATWDPDYEIAKNPVTGTLSVKYKK